jgi:hypothetical protein
MSQPSQPGRKMGSGRRVIASHYAFPSVAWRRKAVRAGKQVQ